MTELDLTDKPQLLDYLKRNHLWAKKGLSQNFLVDKVALDKIVEAAELKDSDLIIEIGAGVGTLTVELVKRASEVITIELDNKLAELLNDSIAKLLTTPKPLLEKEGNNMAMQQYNNEKLRIINADILKLNLNEIIGDRKYKVVANIPYAITSKILELFLSREHKPELMVLLVQKEVAERVCARPGAMSVLSVSVQLYGQPEIIDIVKAESFFPSPKVDSAILRIANLQPATYNLQQEREFFRLVHIGFASRRKTLVNNLSAGYGLDKKKVSDILKSVGINENVRAQELTIEKWRELVDKISN